MTKKTDNLQTVSAFTDHGAIEMAHFYKRSFGWKVVSKAPRWNEDRGLWEVDMLEAKEKKK